MKKLWLVGGCIVACLTAGWVNAMGEDEQGSQNDKGGITLCCLIIRYHQEKQSAQPAKNTGHQSTLAVTQAVASRLQSSATDYNTLGEYCVAKENGVDVEDNG